MVNLAFGRTANRCVNGDAWPWSGSGRKKKYEGYVARSGAPDTSYVALMPQSKLELSQRVAFR